MKLHLIVNPTSLKTTDVSAPLIVRASAATRSHKRMPAAIGRLVIGPIASLLDLSPMTCLGEEAWWLEMPRPIHEALMKRISAGDEKELAAALARLPEMVKSGQVREIERFTEGLDGKAAPAHAKEKTLRIQRGILQGRELRFGAHYTAHPKLDGARLLWIRTEGTGIGADLRVVTQGKLGNTWQATFCVVTDESARLLLERDPRSTQEASAPRAIFNVRTTGELNVEASWFLSAADPFLTGDGVPNRKAGPLQPGSGPEYGESVDTPITFQSGHQQLMSFGHTIRCCILSKGRLEVDAGSMSAAAAKDGLYRRAGAQVEVNDSTTFATKALVFRDYLEESGKVTTASSGQTGGTIEARLTRIPSMGSTDGPDSPPHGSR